ncbi:MAG: hypothetical protein VX899_22875 [Myxococcota bacterium]|nr:hypothetical protein [Myxococcota bacterium]
MHRALIAALLPLTLAACARGGLVCTDDLRSSLSVTLLDADGEPIDGPVQYAVDGGEAESCDQIGDVVGEYVCGWEQPGEFVITASAEGHLETEETLTIEMTEDGCHVDGQTLEIQLEADAS